MLLTTELPASGGEMTDATWEDCLVNEVTASEAPATRGGDRLHPHGPLGTVLHSRRAVTRGSGWSREQGSQRTVP